MLKPRILIVEDTQTVRMIVAKMVEEMGATVVAIATDGIEAEQKFKQHKPNLTLLDIEMPNRNGIDTLKELLKISPDAQVVMLTAVNDISVAEECLEIGARGYLLKEFNTDEFKEGLQDHLNTV